MQRLTRPNLVWDSLAEQRWLTALESGSLTNSTNVAAFEEEFASFIGVKEAVAVSSATVGLTLCLKSLTRFSDRLPNVILPSFTFSASGLAALWAGLPLQLVDSDPSSYTARFSEEHAYDDILMPVHIFGVPATPPVHSKVIIDSAHGLGSKYSDGTRVGAGGMAEVFSLSPTKLMTTGEGGMITTNDVDFAHHLRALRNYGNLGSYNPRGVGINGRMSEFAAIAGRSGLPHVDSWQKERADLVKRYKENMAGVPGLHFQAEPLGSVSSYKDFSVRIDDSRLPVTRDEVAQKLADCQIETRPYFSPSLHDQDIFAEFSAGHSYCVASQLSRQLLCIPLHNKMLPSDVDYVCESLIRAVVG